MNYRQQTCLTGCRKLGWVLYLLYEVPKHKKPDMHYIMYSCWFVSLCLLPDIRRDWRTREVGKPGYDPTYQHVSKESYR